MVPQQDMKTYRSITRDAVLWKLEKIIVVVLETKNLGEGDVFPNVVKAILVAEDTKGNGVMV
jgi:hypothetical protein